MAPALHSLTIRGRNDAAHILQLLLNIRGLRKLRIYERCCLYEDITGLRKLRIHDGCCPYEDITGLFANIVALYPDLEVLSLAVHHEFTSASYHLIPRLKKLSELNIDRAEVYYVCVKLLETHVCIREHM